MRRLLCRHGIFQPRFASIQASPEASSSLAVLAVSTESDVVQRIQQMKPQQVMLETCDQRMTLAAQEKADKDAEVLSHVDAIAFVHGGLRSAQLRSVRKAAEEVGAQVYCVDRSYRETQNRVAKRLLMHPKEMVGFARSSVALLGSQQVPANDAESCPEAVEKILGEEREEHMASEILRRHVSGAKCLVLCCPARREALERRLAQPEAAAIEKVATSRIWPFLLVLVYVVIPGYGTTFIFWRLAKGLGAAIFGDRETAEPSQPPASPGRFGAIAVSSQRAGEASGHEAEGFEQRAAGPSDEGQVRGHSKSSQLGEISKPQPFSEPRSVSGSFSKAMAEESEDVALMKITAKKNVAFYMRAAASFLRGTEDKKPVKELRLTALGEAIGIVASVASRCEKEELAVIKEVDPSCEDGLCRCADQQWNHQRLCTTPGGAPEHLLRGQSIRSKELSPKAAVIQETCFHQRQCWKVAGWSW
eukprot:s1311_g10.t1